MHTLRSRSFVLVILPWIAASATAVGQVLQSSRSPVPAGWVPDRIGIVNDFANAISPAAAARIERIGEEVRSWARGDIVVVTLSQLPSGTQSLLDVRMRIAELWNLPSQPTDERTGAYRLNRGSAFIVLILTQPFAPETHTAGPPNTAFDFSNDPRDLDLPWASRFARVGDFSTAAELLVVRAATLFARDVRIPMTIPLNADSLRRLGRQLWDRWLASNRRELVNQFGVFEVTSVGALWADPVAAKGKQVAVCARFSRTREPNTAVMNGAVLTGVASASDAKTPFRRHLVIAKVLGQREGAPLLQYIASKDRCEWFLTPAELKQ